MKITRALNYVYVKLLKHLRIIFSYCQRFFITWKQHVTKKPALHGLDNKLAKYLSFRDGFFIEVGANDGYAQSNTYFLEKKRGWCGILIEGIPELYEQCKSNREESVVYHCALVSNTYPHKTITMHFANLMSMVDGGMKSEEEQKKQVKRAVERGLSYTIEVPARTLESILDEWVDLPTIDFFSLDVEGYELDVLLGLNIEKYRPRYILVEARYFEEVNEFLVKHKYQLVDKLTFFDYLFHSPAD